MAINFACTNCGIHILPGNSFLICLSCRNYECCSGCQLAGKGILHSSHHTYTLYIQRNSVSPGQPADHTSFGATNFFVPQNPAGHKPFENFFVPQKPADSIASFNPQNPINPAAFTVTPGDPTCFAPVDQPMTPESYWGKLITPHKESSYTFTRLCDSIYRQFNKISCSRIMDPHTFGCVYEAAHTPEDKNFAWHWYTYMAPEVADAKISRVYKHLGYEHYFTAYQGQRTQVPVLTKDGFRTAMRAEVLEDPEAAFGMLNALLEAVPKLVNPVTGKGFEHKVIPRWCFPEERDQELVAALESLQVDLRLVPEIGTQEKKDPQVEVQKVEQGKVTSEEELPGRGREGGEQEKHTEEEERTEERHTKETGMTAEAVRLQRMQDAIEQKNQMAQMTELMMQQVYFTSLAGLAIQNAI